VALRPALVYLVLRLAAGRVRITLPGSRSMSSRPAPAVGRPCGPGLPLALLVMIVGMAAPPTRAADEAPQAQVVVLGEVDFFNIGQDGFCGPRTSIAGSTQRTLRVKAGKRAWFRIESRFRAPVGWYECAGEYSFDAEAGQLHILRHSFDRDACRIEFFRGLPGAAPVRAALIVEKTQSCLGQ
jgi:hypothetical protein